MFVRIRKAAVLACIVAIQLLAIIYYISRTKSTKRDVKNGIKYILYYTKIFDNDTFYMGEGGDIFKNCPISKCYATRNTTLRPIDRYHALMFHGNEYNPHGKLRPAVRSPDQIYIWVNMESPPHSTNYNTTDFYNWSMSYRLDSDIHRYYGYTWKTPRNYTPPSVENIKKIPKKIAWAVSNCKPHNARDKLSYAINKLMPVDIYGRCGNNTCQRGREQNCFEKKYKFYLSFENANCDDYVTEKIYRTLQWDIIPIVYGGANYSKFMPSKSVIDVSQYKSIELLVDHLKELDKDPVKYLEYFAWKKEYAANTSHEKILCSICEKLHQPFQHKIYKEMSEWYNYRNVCRYGKNLPKIVSDLLKK